MAFLALLLLASIVFSGCATAGAGESGPSTQSAGNAAAKACPVTEPVRVTPPEDAAVQGASEPGLYFVNEDRSIWASAWWTEQEEYRLYAGEDGVKVGWFRPADAALEITGRRLDGQSSPLEAHIPCCYPTRFQATGITFPTEGCWEVAAKAAGSELSFVVWIEP